MAAQTSKLLFERISDKRNRLRGPKSWEFLLRLLKNSATNPSLITWQDERQGVFRLVQPDIVAKIWGQRSGKESVDTLTYESFYRSLYHHFKSGILSSISEQDFVFQFGDKIYHSTQVDLTDSFSTFSLNRQ